MGFVGCSVFPTVVHLSSKWCRRGGSGRRRDPTNLGAKARASSTLAAGTAALSNLFGRSGGRKFDSLVGSQVAFATPRSRGANPRLRLFQSWCNSSGAAESRALVGPRHAASGSRRTHPVLQDAALSAERRLEPPKRLDRRATHSRLNAPVRPRRLSNHLSMR